MQPNAEGGPSDDGVAGDRVPILARLDQHSKTLDRAVRLTQMADAKTAPVLALQATLAAVTVSQSATVGDLLDPGGHDMWAVALAAVTLASYIVLALVACILGILVYLPRAPRALGDVPHPAISLVYFDDIRRMPAAEFRARAISVSLDTLEDDLLTQAHTVSGVAALKLSYSRVALLSTIATFLVWLPLIAWAQA